MRQYKFVGSAPRAADEFDFSFLFKKKRKNNKTQSEAVVVRFVVPNPKVKGRDQKRAHNNIGIGVCDGATPAQALSCPRPALPNKVPRGVSPFPQSSSPLRCARKPPAAVVLEQKMDFPEEFRVPAAKPEEALRQQDAPRLPHLSARDSRRQLQRHALHGCLFLSRPRWKSPSYARAFFSFKCAARADGCARDSYSKSEQLKSFCLFPLLLQVPNQVLRTFAHFSFIIFFAFLAFLTT